MCKVPPLGPLVVRRMGSVSEMLTAVPLHQRPDLLEACADLINEEWKRSRASRIHSLQRSTDNFPMCLVLIRTQRTVEETAEGKTAESQCHILGHARLSRVIGQPQSLFVETVVVAKALRGKGYGRKLMEAVENFAKSCGYRRLHLTTHDKQHFYAHLGYSLSKPVQCAGFMSSLVPMEFLESFCPPQQDRELPAGPGKHNPSASYSYRSGANLPLLPPSTHLSFSPVCSAASPPPPPPPLLPACSYHSVAVTISLSSQPPASASSHSSSSQPMNTHVQSLPSATVPPFADCFSAANLPPPPPLPPPAPPMAPLPGHPHSCNPSPSGDKAQGQLFLETPYRDLKGKPIFWMEKDI
ncbi:N-alpha-acetyltransferase 80 [Rhineura floridana]|uniref:N-alpha-acetyltransferase 80 n=1 Tax=Rhineura floridana TaxID=261503 RepID=UPI002AC88E2E|nr:N-alpha-acetyltransferase 80 [Rhineura floridana]